MPPGNPISTPLGKIWAIARPVNNFGMMLKLLRFPETCGLLGSGLLAVPVCLTLGKLGRDIPAGAGLPARYRRSWIADPVPPVWFA